MRGKLEDVSWGEESNGASWGDDMTYRDAKVVAIV